MSPPRSEGVQYATGEEQRRTTNSPRKNDVAGPKQKWYSVVYVLGDGSRIWCCRDQCCIGTWNIRSMNQGKMDMVKQAVVGINNNILAISEFKWIRMGEFNSDCHYIYHCGQESHRRNVVTLIVNNRVWNAVLGCSLKNDRMIMVHFQGKPFNITAIQIYVPTTNAKEAEVDQFYEDLELTPKKGCSIHHWGLECQSKKSGDTWSNRQVWSWRTKWSRAKANWILPKECTGHRKYHLSTTQEMTLHMDITKWSILKSNWLHSL